MTVTTVRFQRRPVSVSIPFDASESTNTAAAVTPKSASRPHEFTFGTPLLSKFIASHRELENYRIGQPVVVDGRNISIAAVAAASRYAATVLIDNSFATLTRMEKSREVITTKIAAGTSVYGVSTGFGGSADTRTNEPLLLGNALLQLLQSGVLPSSCSKPLDVLPLLDPIASTSMPESWVRGAILIRMNSLIRGHSGVRMDLVKKMNEVLNANITPVVPLRGSISASGDLSPLSYIAGALTGNQAIRVFDGPRSFGSREIRPSGDALRSNNIQPISLASKEHLGLLNGTAFSASVAALALNDAIHLAFLALVCTAMGTEALTGSRGSFDSFIHDIRPHPGQIESARIIWDLLEGSTFAATHEDEVTIDEDEGVLRQDRYPLRTSPQFLGPQIEDLLETVNTITIECNATTDNPLVDVETGRVHHGGNFQAMAVTNAMEKTRLALHHIGKLLFSQCTELVNPAMNHGLPPSLAATDPSLDYHCKGVDIATAAYVAELGYLANPVSTHIQSAEMHNQAVNSMALVSARATINSLEVLSLLSASYLYVLCQALDLRALQKEFYDGFKDIVKEALTEAFGHALSVPEREIMNKDVLHVMRGTLEATSTMDAPERLQKIAASSTTIIISFLHGRSTFSDNFDSLQAALASISKFRIDVAQKGTDFLNLLRQEYLSGARGPAPASRFLNKTRPVYELVRVTLGIKMHGSENLARFDEGLYVDEQSVGQNVSLIHECIRDGKMQSVIVGLLA
ncbi:hypothetical protein H0H92_002776 [Tricholoma furcatifolium]|nr:hypothetical protein H0H92_002776 [Tricholoma furcatifolium]